MLDESKPAPVSLIIVNYNAGPLLADCVNSGLEQVGEVILVDNASTDDSLHIVKLQNNNNSKINILKEDVNLGFATACNIGIEAASYAIIC